MVVYKFLHQRRNSGARPMEHRILPKRMAYSVEEAADLLGISRAKAYAACREGTIPCLRFGKRVVVPAAPFEQMLGHKLEEVA
jgi:excisionase family DNA binding protein